MLVNLGELWRLGHRYVLVDSQLSKHTAGGGQLNIRPAASY